MNRHYQYISQSLAIAIIAIASTMSSPAWAQSTQPRQGDADQLRPAQGQPISPTNTDEFSPNQELLDSNLKIQNVNLEVGTLEPVIPGNNNASPQKVNKSGNFSSDPLNAIQIFQNSGTSRR
jgi:hypothetical protein